MKWLGLLQRNFVLGLLEMLLVLRRHFFCRKRSVRIFLIGSPQHGPLFVSSYLYRQSLTRFFRSLNRFIVCIHSFLLQEWLQEFCKESLTDSTRAWTTIRTSPALFWRKIDIFFSSSLPILFLLIKRLIFLPLCRPLVRTRLLSLYKITSLPLRFLLLHAAENSGQEGSSRLCKWLLMQLGQSGRMYNLNI